MQRKIRKVAVLGSGVMGSGIAAHLANCGVPSVLLDIVPKYTEKDEKEGVDKDSKAFRNRLAIQNLALAIKNRKPIPAFYHNKFAELISVGNFDDDMDQLADCDWIIEVVIENMKIKQSVFANVEKNWNGKAIISSNTSGMPIHGMVEGRSQEFKKHFMVTHFFNPVRFMRLLELVAGPDTDPKLVDFMAGFGSKVLGKGVVFGKDTVNFVANRIGVYGMMRAMKEMTGRGYTIEEVDAIVGQPMGRPKTAAFRTADLVGLDTFHHVTTNCYDNLPDDPERDIFTPPAFFDKLVKEGKLGNKTKGGFYKKGPKKERLVLDWKTMDYIPQEKMKADSIGAAKRLDDPGKRIKTMVTADDRAGAFAWKACADGLIYAGNRIPDISDSVVEIDRGMKWGFNQALGPFEVWDAIGVKESTDRMKSEGAAVPEKVEKMLAAGNESFYLEKEDGRYYYDFATGEYKKIEVDPRVFDVAEMAKANKSVVERVGEHYLFCMGDGVLLASFHNEAQMNAIDDDLMTVIEKGLDLCEKGDFGALVVGNNKLHQTPMDKVFCAGANVMMLMMFAQQEQWSMIDMAVKKLQDLHMRMRYGKVPVVIAPAGKALGGGCEMVMHGDRVVAGADLFMGLVEMGLGLIPAGGGTKEATRRVTHYVPDGVVEDYLPYAKKALMMLSPPQNISNSAKSATEIGYLTRDDITVVSHDLQLFVAKQVALGLASGYYDPGAPRQDIPLAGKEVYAAMQVFAHGMKNAGHVTEYEAMILGKLAKIVTGGDVISGTLTDEQTLLEQERELFLSLMGEEKTQERIRVFLTEKRMIRN